MDGRHHAHDNHVQLAFALLQVASLDLWPELWSQASGIGLQRRSKVLVQSLMSCMPCLLLCRQGAEQAR